MRFAPIPLMALFLMLGGFVTTAQADDVKPDDMVIFTLSAEDWVTTQTARVTVGVEAAVTAASTGTARADMQKAVNDLAKGDWRLITFNRSQDQTGMERWSAQYEARLPEAQLGGLNESAKKASKPGMQVTVYNIDFSPTLDERQAVQNQLRARIYKMANEQLATLNTILGGRNYRIAMIDFSGYGAPQPMMAKAEMLRSMAAPVAMDAAGGEAMERSEKATISARVVLSALAPAAALKP